MDRHYYGNALREFASRLEATDDPRTLKRIAREASDLVIELKFDTDTLRVPETSHG